MRSKEAFVYSSSIGRCLSLSCSVNPRKRLSQPMRPPELSVAAGRQDFALNL
jgi:hypothetical protein